MIESPFLQRIALWFCVAWCAIITTVHAQPSAGPLPVLWQTSVSSAGDYNYNPFIRPVSGGYLVANSFFGSGGFGVSDISVIRLNETGGVIWNRLFGGSSSEETSDCVMHADGSSVVSGYSSSGVSGNKTNVNAPGAWMLKIDPYGNKLWESFQSCYRFGSYVPHLAAAGDGSDFVSTTVPGADFTAFGPWGEIRGRFYDMMISKQGADSSQEWSVTYHIGFTNRVQSMRGTHDGGVVVAGNTPTYEGLWRLDYLLMRLDPQGQYVWGKTYGGTSNESLVVVRETPDGGFLLAGDSASPPGNSKTSPLYGGLDCWIVKTDAQGVKQWDRSYGGSGQDQVGDLVVLSDGGFVVGATSDSTNGNKRAPLYGVTNAWIFRCDAQGNVLWEQTLGSTGSERLTSLSQTADGGFIAAMNTTGGVGGNKTEPLLGLIDSWVVKLGPEPGWLAWERCCEDNGLTQWRLLLQGESNVNYRVDISTDLQNWAPFSTNQATGSSVELLHSPSGMTAPHAFYRALALP